MDVGGEAEGIGDRVVRDLGDRLPRAERAGHERDDSQQGGGDQGQKCRTHGSSYLAARADTDRIRIFCTRQAMISETYSLSGLRQSISCTVLNSPACFPGLPNRPTIVPSSSIL